MNELLFGVNLTEQKDAVDINLSKTDSYKMCVRIAILTYC